jgi:hypothetical protein
MIFNEQLPTQLIGWHLFVNERCVGGRRYLVDEYGDGRQCIVEDWNAHEDGTAVVSVLVRAEDPAGAPWSPAVVRVPPRPGDRVLCLTQYDDEGMREIVLGLPIVLEGWR